MIQACNNHLMHKETIISIVLPVYNEESSINQSLNHLYHQKKQSDQSFLDKNKYEIIVVNNNSTDDTIAQVIEFSNKFKDFNIVIIDENNQGVAWARKAGMDYAVTRSRQRDAVYNIEHVEHYIYSTDADCVVDAYWIDATLSKLDLYNCLTVSQYHYTTEHFAKRACLWKVIELVLKARDYAMKIFGGFPDGKGFAIPRSAYEKVNGIDIFYQLKSGKFICHLSDDWDFGIKVRASGQSIVYAHDAKVLTNPRRIDHALNDMIHGIAYGSNGIISMQDIRPKINTAHGDISESESKLLYEFSIKDFTTKHIILPILLTPSFLNQNSVIEFLTSKVCQQLALRIEEIKNEMRILDFIPIHRYKTPCYRLYFEFRNELFERMRECIDPAIGFPPNLPACLEDIQDNKTQHFRQFVYYYCEDREAGEAHNYFGNGGVF